MVTSRRHANMPEAGGYCSRTGSGTSWHDLVDNCVLLETKLFDAVITSPFSVRFISCQGFQLRPAWISNHVHIKLCVEIIYSFPNFNGCTVDDWEYFHPIHYDRYNYLSMLGLMLIHVSERVLGHNNTRCPGPGSSSKVIIIESPDCPVTNGDVALSDKWSCHKISQRLEPQFVL